MTTLIYVDNKINVYDNSYMSLVTVVIPVGYPHEHLVDVAIASVQQQTVTTSVIPYFDHQGRGAGYARNQGAAKVDTPFVVFLDADDQLEPTFIEKCLNAYTKGHYVYTGWQGLRPVMPAAENPYRGEGFHLVTTLIPTAAFRAVGGFDEALPGHEDADLYFKLIMAGVCGIRVPEYLVRYSPHGVRGKSFRDRADYETIRQQVYERNGGERIMACCGAQGQPVVGDPGSKQEGDVLAIAQWTGIRNVAGQGGARIYRGGNFSQIWVAPADIEARPDLFKRTFTVADLTPDSVDVLKESGLLG